MRIFFVFIIFLITLSSNLANASYWYECEVQATLENTRQPNVYIAEIHHALMTQGHNEAGTACLENKYGKKVQITVDEGLPPSDKQISLKYEFFETMTNEGLLITEKWIYTDPSLKGGLPW